MLRNVNDVVWKTLIGRISLTYTDGEDFPERTNITYATVLATDDKRKRYKGFGASAKITTENNTMN